MSDVEEQNSRIRIDLTTEQQEKVKAETGKDAVSLQFTAEELEERVVPLVGV